MGRDDTVTPRGAETPFLKPGLRSTPTCPYRDTDGCPEYAAVDVGAETPYLTSPWLAGQHRRGAHPSGRSVHLDRTATGPGGTVIQLC